MIPLEEIYGNRQLKETVSGIVERNACPNSLIISGREGSGKKTFAAIISMALACESSGKKPCMNCRFCKRIESGESQDMRIIDLQDKKKTIGIDEVRDIQSDLVISPGEMSVKLYIIRHADKMTPAAQNCLLKCFEEPPKNVYFILLCESSGALLPTVRSRAPELRTEVFKPAQLEDYLSGNKKAETLKRNDPEGFAAMIRMADGSIGRLNALLDGKNRKNPSADLALEAADCISRRDEAGLVTAFTACGTDRTKAAETLSCLLLALRDMAAVRRAREESPLLFFPNREKAREYGARLPLKSIIAFFETVLETRLNLDANTNVRLALSSLAAHISEK